MNESYNKKERKSIKSTIEHVTKSNLFYSLVKYDI